MMGTHCMPADIRADTPGDLKSHVYYIGLSFFQLCSTQSQRKTVGSFCAFFSGWHRGCRCPNTTTTWPIFCESQLKNPHAPCNRKVHLFMYSNKIAKKCRLDQRKLIRLGLLVLAMLLLKRQDSEHETQCHGLIAKLLHTLLGIMGFTHKLGPVPFSQRLLDVHTVFP